MQTVLITGTNGFVAHYLACLLAPDYCVIGIGKGPCRMEVAHSNFQYFALDFIDEPAVKALFSKEHPDIVVHAGAVSKPDECELDKDMAYNVNVEATKYLLRYAREWRSFFVFLSTDFIFDGQQGMYKEEDIPDPVNYYGKTKLLAEAEVKAYPHDWSIVRTVLVYGHPKGGRDNILTIVAKALKEGKTSKIVDDQVRTPTYVEDLACGIKTIIDQRKTGIYHLSGEEVLTPYQMTVAAARYLNLDETLIEAVNASTFQQPAIRPLKTGFNLAKAKRELGYTPTSFSEGLRKTFLENNNN